MAHAVFCRCCKALVGYMTLDQAKRTYPEGCYYCGRALGQGSDASKAALKEMEKVHGSCLEEREE